VREFAADVLVAEIGSTTTVVNAFADLASPHPVFLGQGMAPTSVPAGDVTIGLREATVDLENKLGGRLHWQRMLAVSSAAGGLRMTVHGLAYEMTARAAREAALGAGAIVRMVTAGELTIEHLARLEDIRPNIILLAGGVDHGETKTALQNAALLAKLPLDAPIIYAGNSACRDEVAHILRRAGKRVLTVENVYPRIDELNVLPARRAIQQVFEEHIVHAPGMEKIRSLVQGTIMPTPGAVMQAAELLYRHIGDLLVVDVGGATTDVHSVTMGSEELSRLAYSPEPLAKRTVEGDLGVYVNAEQVALLVTPDEAKQSMVDLGAVIASWGAFPKTPEEVRALELLTAKAVGTALERHAGCVKHLYGPGGKYVVAMGRDLTAVKWVIGTGGPLTRLAGAADLLRLALRPSAKQTMYPREFRVVIDRHYNLAVLGVLSQEYKGAAEVLMEQSLNIGGETGAVPNY